MKIGVKGYQSVKKALIEIPPGEIVGISGENNRGKSACLRAVMAAILNESGNHYVNNDLGETVVVLSNDRGAFKWSKTKNSSATYQKGRDLPVGKLNRSYLDVVYPEAGFPVIKEAGEIFAPYVIPEGTIPFPFNMSASSAFKVFSRFLASNKVQVLIQEVKEEAKELKGEIKSLEVKVDVLNTTFSEKYSKLKEMPPQESLEALKNSLVKLIFNREKLDSKRKQVNSLQSNLLTLRGTLGGMKPQVLRELSSKLEGHRDLLQKRGLYEVRVAKVKQLRDQIESSGVRLRGLRGFVDVVEPRLMKMAHAVELRQQFGRVTTELEVGKEELKGIKIQLEKRILKLEGEKFCPLCKRPFGG